MSLQQLNNPGLIWFITGLILLLTELFAPSLILMFFGLGAWIVTVLCLLLNVGFSMQLMVFAISSIMLLIFLRQKLKPVFLGYVSSRQDSGRNIDDYTGKVVVVIARIDPDKPGRVELNGVAWDAESDNSIDVDLRARIIDRNGLRLKVEPL